MSAQNVPAQRQETQITPQQVMINRLTGDKMKAAIRAVAPAYCDPARFLTIAIAAAKAVAADEKVDPNSVLVAIHDAAKLGLYLDKQMQHAALVPYFDRNTGMKIIQCQPMYKGLIHMARESANELVDIRPYIVYKADEFRTWNDRQGTNFEHVPSLEDGREASGIVGGYTLSWFKEEEAPRYYWVANDKILRVERMAKRKPKGGKSWKDDDTRDDMVLKTLIRQTLKWLDLSPQVAIALGIDNQTEANRLAGVRPMPSAEIADIIDADYRDPLQDEVDIAAEGGKPDVADTVELQDEPAGMTAVEAAQAEIGPDTSSGNAEAPKGAQVGSEEAAAANGEVEDSADLTKGTTAPLVEEQGECPMTPAEFHKIVLNTAKIAKLTSDQVHEQLEAEFSVEGGLAFVDPKDYNAVIDHFMQQTKAVDV